MVVATCKPSFPALFSRNRLPSVAALTQELVKSNLFLERAQILWNECLEGVKDAKDAVKVHRKADGAVVFDGRDFAAFAALLNQAHRNLELYGRATGALRDDAGVVNVQNMMVILPRQPVVQRSADDYDLDVTVEKT
jgi:hypothetical protein